MKKIILFNVLCAFLQLSTQEEFQPFMEGGVPAILGQYPSLVGINIQPNRFCGGVILNANHVLTAGSCVLETTTNNLIAPSQLTIRAGVVAIVAQTPAIQVLRVYVHPLFNPWSFENDIAVLRTAVNLVFENIPVPPMAISDINHNIVGDNVICQVAGWNWVNGAATNNLQSMDLEIYNRDSCDDNELRLVRVRESMICARPTSPNQRICLTNRGGGLFCDGKLTGIISNRFGCDVTTNYIPTILTQVRFYEQWIDAQFRRLDNPPAGPTPMPDMGGSASALRVSLFGVALLTVVVHLFEM